MGTIFAHNTGKALKTSNTQGNKLTYITTSNLYWDRFELVSLKEMYFTEAEVEKYSATKGDLLVCEGGDIGRAAIWSFDYDIRLQNHIHKLRRFYHIETRFYYYIFNYYKAIGKINGNGIGLQGLSSNVLHNLIVPLPPLSEQQKIVSNVDSSFVLIDFIDTNKELIEKDIADIKSKILELAIQGKLVEQDENDEPASVLLERIYAEKKAQLGRKYVESYIYKGDDNCYYEKVGSEVKNITEEIPFEIPKTWSWCRLGEYCQKVTDQVASGSFAALRENVPSLKTPDYAIMVKTADFSHNFTQDLTYTTKAGYDFLENSNLFGGELILSNIGSVGKVFIVPKLQKKMTLAPNSIMLRFYEEIQKDYFYYFFLSSIGLMHLLSISRGATILKFNKTDLKTLPIPIPPINEQLRMATQIQKLFELVELKDEV